MGEAGLSVSLYLWFYNSCANPYMQCEGERAGEACERADSAFVPVCIYDFRMSILILIYIASASEVRRTERANEWRASRRSLRASE